MELHFELKAMVIWLRTVCFYDSCAMAVDKMNSEILTLLNNESTELSQLPEHYSLIIGELARIVDLEPKTIRFYEKIGLLKPARQGKFRIFRKKDAEHLMLIKTLRKFGLSTQMIRAILEAEEGAGSQASNSPPEAILKNQLDAMRDQQAQLANHIALLSGLLERKEANARGLQLKAS